MAADEIYEIHREPCVCGSGHFVVIEREPDHFFANLTHRTWQSHIECEQCRKEYVIEHRVPAFVVAKSADVERAKAAHDDRYLRRQMFMNSSEVVAAKEALAAYLLSLPSKAAVYRRLVAAGFWINSSQGTFTRHYTDAGTWVQRNIHSPADVITALKILSRHDEPLAAHADELGREFMARDNDYDPVKTLGITRGGGIGALPPPDEAGS